MPRFLRLILVFFSAVIALLSLAVAVFASPLQRPLSSTTWTVGGTCGTTIQACINAASNGDTVLIPAGTYNEYLTLGKSISLTGSSAATTIVRSPSGTSQPVLNISGGGPMVSGLTLTGGTSNAGGGITIQGAVATIQNVTITGNKAGGGGGGIYISFGASAVLADVVITGNQTMFPAGFGGSGLLMGLGAGPVRMTNTLIADNPDSSGQGQVVVLAGTLTAVYTTIANSTQSSGAGVWTTGGTAVLTNTLVTNQTTGFRNSSGSIIENYNLFFGNATDKSGTISGGANDVFGDPMFTNPAAGNYHILGASAARAVGVNVGVNVDFEGDARPSDWFGKSGFDIGYDQFVARPLPPAVCDLVESHGLTATGDWQNTVNFPSFTWNAVAGAEIYKVIYNNNGQHVITTTQLAYTLPPLQSDYATDLFVEPHYLADPEVNNNPGSCLFTIRYDDQPPVINKPAAFTANFPDKIWTSLTATLQITAVTGTVHDGWFEPAWMTCTPATPFTHSCESGSGLNSEQTYFGPDPNGTPSTLWGPVQTWQLGSVPDGIYYFRLSAFDNLNQVNGPATLRTLKLDTIAPTAVLTYTGSNPSILNLNLPVKWSGNDSGSGIASYDVLVNGVVWLSHTAETSATYTGDCDTNYQFVVRANDAAGNTGLSNTQSVLVKCDLTSPVVAITAPVINQIISGTQFIIAGTASDNVQVASVAVSTDAGVTWNTPTGLTTWTYTWSVPSQAGVTYVLLARATDGVGNVTTSTPVTVTIDQVLRIYLPLVLRNYDPARDSYEPDDTYQQAQSIPSDGSLQHRNFYPAGDVDWARLEVGPGTYIIATSGLAQGNTYPDTVMALYASNGVTQLANNDDCSLTTRASCLTWTVSTSTTLYIKVWPYDANSAGSNSWYDLSVVKQ